MCRPRVCDEDAGCEFRIAIELQAELDEVAVAIARFAAAQHKSAVRKGRVIAFQFRLGNEGYGGVVIREIVRHLDDFLGDCSLIRAVFQDDEALPRVLFACAQLRIFSMVVNEFRGEKKPAPLRKRPR